jgi:hypothetical protein
VLTLVLALALCHTPDAHRLHEYSAMYAVPLEIVERVACMESGDNLSPRLRGHRCWWSLDLSDPSVTEVLVFPGEKVVRAHGHTWLLHHEPSCEVGRFQIKPTTARLRCPGVNVFTREGNYQCFFTMFSEDMRARGLSYAIRHHNGAGDHARWYLRRITHG